MPSSHLRVVSSHTNHLKGENPPNLPSSYIPSSLLLSPLCLHTQVLKRIISTYCCLLLFPASYYNDFQLSSGLGNYHRPSGCQMPWALSYWISLRHMFYEVTPSFLRVLFPWLPGHNSLRTVTPPLPLLFPFSEPSNVGAPQGSLSSFFPLCTLASQPRVSTTWPWASPHG